MDANFLDKNLEQLHFEERRALEQLQNVTIYRKAFFEVYAAVKREAQQRAKDSIATLHEVVGNEAFSSLDKAISHRARCSCCVSFNLYHYATLAQEDFYETGVQLIALIESQPHFLHDNISDYIAALSNQVLACGLLKYDEVRACLKELRELKPITSDDRCKIHQQYYTNFFALCTYSGDFEAALVEMKHVSLEATGFDQKGYETASFQYQYALISFGCQDLTTRCTMNDGSITSQSPWSGRICKCCQDVHFDIAPWNGEHGFAWIAAPFGNPVFEEEKQVYGTRATVFAICVRTFSCCWHKRSGGGVPKNARWPARCVRSTCYKSIAATFDLDAWLKARWMVKHFVRIVTKEMGEEGWVNLAFDTAILDVRRLQIALCARFSLNERRNLRAALNRG